MDYYGKLDEINRITNLPIGVIIKIINPDQPEEELTLSDHPYYTVDQAKIDYYSQKTNSREELIALMGWLSFVTTVDEAERMYFQCPGGSETEKAVVRKLYELL